MNPQRGDRCFRFGAPTIEKSFACGQIVRHFSVLTVGSDDEHNTVPLSHCTRHAAPGRNALVVGVCVKTDKRAHRL